MCILTGLCFISGDITTAMNILHISFTNTQVAMEEEEVVVVVVVVGGGG